MFTMGLNESFMMSLVKWHDDYYGHFHTGSDVSISPLISLIVAGPCIDTKRIAVIDSIESILKKFPVIGTSRRWIVVSSWIIHDVVTCAGEYFHSAWHLRRAAQWHHRQRLSYGRLLPASAQSTVCPFFQWNNLLGRTQQDKSWREIEPRRS